MPAPSISTTRTVKNEKMNPKVMLKYATVTKIYATELILGVVRNDGRWHKKIFPTSQRPTTTTQKTTTTTQETTTATQKTIRTTQKTNGIERLEVAIVETLVLIVFVSFLFY